MKRRLAGILLTAAVVGLLGGCGEGGGTARTEESAVESEEDVRPTAVEKEGAESDVEIENPFIDVNAPEHAAKLSGFDLTLPGSLDGYEAGVWRSIPGQMTEVILTGQGNEIRLRKGRGEEDISGDYNTYSKEEELMVGDVKVTEKKNDDGIHLALWTSGGFSFAMMSDQGLDGEFVSGIISGTA